MAQQNLAEDTKTDFSGLASSLLPPSGAFFSGWTPEQWQSFIASHNTRNTPDSPTAHRSYDPNEYQASDRPRRLGEVPAPVSAASADSAQVNVRQETNGGGYETNLTPPHGANQIRPASTAFLENNTSSSRNGIRSTATPPGALAELKLKAKESIMAKKAQNIRSSSQESVVQMNGTELNNAINGEARTQVNQTETQVEATQHGPSFAEEGSTESIQSQLSLSTDLKSQRRSTEASKLFSPATKANKNLVLPKGDRSGLKASSVELEDLLAEGKAAVEMRPPIAPELTRSRSGPERRTRVVLADDSKPASQTGIVITAKSSVNPLISSKGSLQQWETSETDQNGMDSRDERYLQGPVLRQGPAKFSPEKSSTGISLNSSKLGADRDIDMSNAPKPEDLGHQTYGSQFYKPPGSQEQMITDENSVAKGQYNVDDVQEWLTITGFYDEVYRQKVLHRRRRMKAIEDERVQLFLEEQADQEQRNQLVRSQSVLATNAGPISPFLARGTSILPLPMPPMDSSVTKDLGLKIKDSALKNDKPLAAATPAENVVKMGSLKRRKSLSEMKEEEGQAQKMMRTESGSHDTASSIHLGDKASAGSSVIHRHSPQARTERPADDQQLLDPRYERDQNANHNIKRRYDQWVPDKPAVLDDRRRASYDNRDVRSYDSDRRNTRPAFTSGPRYADSQNLDYRTARYAEQDRYQRSSKVDPSSVKSGINLRVSNVRYFLIKSWNYENIETAQRECTWCTQTKNEDLFVDAFRNSTHVMLIFSANNSHAFQGYARMQSLPGEPGVVDPTWRKYLHWPTTKPFKIRWITKGNSSYRVAGDLRNPLNEDSMVFVGRDGQEIPDYVGLELCEALDHDAKYRSNRLD